MLQTRVPAEIIIVDDCSTDNSVAVAEAICTDNPIVRLIKRQKRGGPNEAIVTGLQHSSGDYVNFAAADDFVGPEFAAGAIASLEQYPQSAFCFFDPSSFDEESGEFTRIPLALATKPVYFSPDALEAIFAKNYFTISSNTVIYRRSAIVSIGGFSPELEWQADWFTNLVLAFRHGVCYRPQAAAHFVVNPDSYGAAGVNSPIGQKRLLFACLDALEGSYSDVAAHFKAAGLVPEMRFRVLLWLLGDPRGRRFVTLLLAGRLVKREIWAAFRPLVPVSVRRWMRRNAASATPKR